MENEIWFKSMREFFVMEKTNIKRNTVRFTDDWSANRWAEFDSAEYVGIEMVELPARFRRKIKHKCKYKNLAIISW